MLHEIEGEELTQMKDAGTLVRVAKGDLTRRQCNEVWAAFERLGATGIQVEQQVTEATEDTKWTISGDLIATNIHDFDAADL
jgi:hypothetical protein